MKAVPALLPTLLAFLPLVAHAQTGTTVPPASTSDAPSSALSSASFSASSSALPANPTAAPSPSDVSSGLSSTPVSSVSSSPSLPTASSTSTSTPLPTVTPGLGTLEDMDVIRARRIDAIVNGVVRIGSVSNWLFTLNADGKWPDSEVNYRTGCNAQRANWPASEHWTRITTMAAAYHGGTANASQWANNAELHSAISNAMDWWFSRDMATDACLDGGGGSSCPCGTAGLWNTNWFSNVILVPNLVVQSCLMLNDTLTETQSSSCSHFATRSSSPFYRAKPPGFVSGANILDMSKIAIDYSLRVLNATRIEEAYGRIHAQMVIVPEVLVDGIKPDGSFGQHLGLLYNGNYGKDFANSVLALEEAALGTQFSADDDARSAFGSLIDADRWMVFYNTVTKVLHWDFSVLPRFISFAVKDAQATESIKLNVTQIGSVGQEWGNDNMTEFADSLSGDFENANAGQLTGNRMFWSNDYMVHRGDNYVTTLKMYSSRTLNTECTNTQNPLGFHLADGTLFTYKTGPEYEDIAASWDWNLIPGTTVDYGATPLSCDKALFQGIERFVGGASTGQVGAAAMRYTNPNTKNFSFQKAWFFLDDDVQHIMISNIASKTNAPVYSVLDQKRHNGRIIANGARLHSPVSNTSNARTLWHDDVGYTFDGPYYPTVTVQTGNRTGNWSAIGTSTQPPTTVDLFSARIIHTNLTAPVAYTAYPGTDLDAFRAKSRASGVRTVRNDAQVAAVWDDAHQTAMIVFWDAAGGSVEIECAGVGTLTIGASANSAVIYRADKGEVTVSDPGQTLESLELVVHDQTLIIDLPSGGMAGSSVTTQLDG